jgi:hypothetical protein
MKENGAREKHETTRNVAVRTPWDRHGSRTFRVFYTFLGSGVRRQWSPRCDMFVKSVIAADGED